MPSSLAPNFREKTKSTRRIDVKHPRKGKEREGKGRKGKEREGKGRKGKEREGKGRKGKEREGRNETFVSRTSMSPKPRASTPRSA